MAQCLHSAHFRTEIWSLSLLLDGFEKFKQGKDEPSIRLHTLFFWEKWVKSHVFLKLHQSGEKPPHHLCQDLLMYTQLIL